MPFLRTDEYCPECYGNGSLAIFRTFVVFYKKTDNTNVLYNMKNDDEIFESLIAGGIIGAMLGAMLSKNKPGGATLGGMAGAAILATYKANEKAKQTNVSQFITENNSLYEISANGTKRFVRDLEKPAKQLPNHFKLK